MRMMLSLLAAVAAVAVGIMTASGSGRQGSNPGFEVLLRSRRFTPQRGTNAETRDALRTAGASALTAGRKKIHALIQLGEIPGAGRREELARAGVELLTYLPNYAWLAALPADDPLRSASLPGVRWVGTLAAEDKLHPSLRRGELGAWAYDKGSGLAVVLVQLFRDAGLDAGEEAVRKHGGRVIGEAALINTLVAEMPSSALNPLAAEDIVEWIEQPIPPLQPINAENRAIVGANTLQMVPYNLDGSGVNVLVFDVGRADSHLDLNSHMDYGDSTPFDASYHHPTHVACTLCGNGTAAYNNRGMAPAANLLSMGFEWDDAGVFLYTNPGDIQNDFDYAKNTWLPSADLVNVSLGTNTAWNGFPCSYEGNYGLTDQLLDSIVRGSLGEPFIMAWANGNERGGACGSSYHTTAPPACAKNPIQSGATDESDAMSSFSSWGPTDDGRIKPVICSPGVNVLSCTSGSSYGTLSGTSMASPTTAGIIALMLQQYRATYATAGEFLPSSAKALLIHTAVDLGSTGPDYQFGYGRINGVAAVDQIIAQNLREESIGAPGEIHEYSIAVSPGTPELRVSLAWDDPPGTLVAVKKLVNDLDLELVAPGGAAHSPWVLDPASPGDPARTGVDSLNNQEQVLVSSPSAGSWKIRVRATVLPDAPQAYSIVFPGAAGIAPSVAAGATPTPTATSNGYYEAMTNGDFESGAAPWAWSGSAVRTPSPHSGSYAARLGGTNDGSLSQQLSVPSIATGATLTYWVRMDTSESTHPWDFLDVELRDGSNSTLTTLQSLSDGDGFYQGSWRQETFALGADYAGRTARIVFQADVDSMVNTYFSVDDVSLTICYSGTLPTPTPDATGTPPPTPTPTPTPLVDLIMSSGNPAVGQPFNISVKVEPIARFFDAWGVILGPGNRVYSFTLGQPGILRTGAVPLAVNVPGLDAPYAALLYSIPAIPNGSQGNYTVIAGLTPPGTIPRGPQDAIPGYVDTETVAVAP
jgi:hypothetical protein